MVGQREVPQFFRCAAVSGAGASLLSEAGLLRKVYFPRECVVVGAVGSFLPDLILNLVCMLGSARSFSVGLQRIGRSGHWRGGIPKGRLFPVSRDEQLRLG